MIKNGIEDEKKSNQEVPAHVCQERDAEKNRKNFLLGVYGHED